jgi:hypothetical protein
MFLVNISKQTRQDTVAKSDAYGVNVQKRKRDESTLDIICKKHKVSWAIMIVS